MGAEQPWRASAGTTSAGTTTARRDAHSARTNAHDTRCAGLHDAHSAGTNAARRCAHGARPNVFRDTRAYTNARSGCYRGTEARRLGITDADRHARRGACGARRWRVRERRTDPAIRRSTRR